MTGTNHTSSQTRQAKFDTYVVSIGIDDRVSTNMSYYKQDFEGPLKNYGALSTDFWVQRCTQFMSAPSLGPLITILSILIGYKYPTHYMIPKYVNSSSVPNIGHRTQHLLMQILLPWMAPSVPPTIILLP